MSTWELDNVELTSVGLDIGSSTSHLVFSRLRLQRLAQSLSSRFVVVRRQTVHRSPVRLTPFRDDGLIDAEALGSFVRGAYLDAALVPARQYGNELLYGLSTRIQQGEAPAIQFVQ